MHTATVGNGKLEPRQARPGPARRRSPRSSALYQQTFFGRESRGQGRQPAAQVLVASLLYLLATLVPCHFGAAFDRDLDRDLDLDLDLDPDRDRHLDLCCIEKSVPSLA